MKILSQIKFYFNFEFHQIVTKKKKKDFLLNEIDGKLLLIKRISFLMILLNKFVYLKSCRIKQEHREA